MDLNIDEIKKLPSFANSVFLQNFEDEEQQTST
jgi:hypothetical protein